MSQISWDYKHDQINQASEVQHQTETSQIINLETSIKVYMHRVQKYILKAHPDLTEAVRTNFGSRQNKQK